MVIHDEASFPHSSSQKSRFARKIQPILFAHPKLRPALSPADTTSNDSISRENLRHLEKCPVDSSVARYRRTAAIVSFNDPATAFTYAANLIPGIHFYTFLAAKDAPLSEPDYCKHRRGSRLQLNVPDTIIYGDTGHGIWIFTDKTGHVQRSSNFSDKHVFDRMAQGPATFDAQHLVVYKEAVVQRLPGTLPSGEKSAAFHSQGNQVRLLTLDEAKMLLNGGTAVQKSFALQQFIQCKGSQIFLHRAVYEAGKPSYAWIIRNTEPGTGASLLSRFCTRIETDKACTFVRLTERGCAAVSELNVRIVRYLEQQFHLLFQTFVADFIKDSAGTWWFIQVKAFRIQSRCRSDRIVALPRRLQRAYLKYRMPDDEDDSFDRDDPRGNRREIVPLSKRSVHKLYPCKSCHGNYPSTDLSFKMTFKMIHDMHARIRLRLLPGKRLAFLSHPFAELPESVVSYEALNVCTSCYTIYERDQHLQRIESRFSALVRLSGHKAIKSESDRVKDRNREILSLVPRHLTLCRLVFVISAIYDICLELFHAEKDEVATDQVEWTRGPQSRLYLRIQAFDYSEWIPLNPANVMKACEKTSSEARREKSDFSWRADDVNGLDNPSESSYWLPMNLVRVVPFFAPLDSKWKDSRGTLLSLTEENSVHVQLIRASEPPVPDFTEFAVNRRLRTPLIPIEVPLDVGALTHAIVLGSTNIRLPPLPPCVSTCDYDACVAIERDRLQIKGKIGFERLRCVDFDDVKSRAQVRAYHGIFLPDGTYTSCDAFSSEWMEAFRQAQPIYRSSGAKVEKNLEISAIEKVTQFRELGAFSISEARPLEKEDAMDLELESMIEDDAMDEELEAMIEPAHGIL